MKFLYSSSSALTISTKLWALYDRLHFVVECKYFDFLVKERKREEEEEKVI